MSPLNASPGAVIDGKYRVERIIAHGGMGVVAEATHLVLNVPVAIKFLLPKKTQDTECVDRFSREARAVASLHSEHVVRVHDFGTLDDGAPYLVMEYLEGIDLGSYARRHGPRPLDEVVTFMLQICEGLATTHAAGIVHRDLKPANVFLTRLPGGEPRLKILDFGISKAPQLGPRITDRNQVMGSPGYMAPEQMSSSRDVDHRADIWALGVLLYQLLTGRPPFSGKNVALLSEKVLTEEPDSLAKWRPDLPPEIEGIVSRCLAKAPRDRFQNVTDLAEALAPS
jgi:eukaryotic-like serine/threonine-protein kinase